MSGRPARRGPPVAQGLCLLAVVFFAIPTLLSVALVTASFPRQDVPTVVLIVLGLSTFIAVLHWARLLTRYEAEAHCCAACGYELRHLRSARCPECGTAFDGGGGETDPISW